MAPKRGSEQARVLADPKLDRALRRDGYVVVPLIPAEVARAMRVEFGEIHGWSRHQLMDAQPPDFEIAMWNGDLEYRHRIDDLVERGAVGATEDLFVAHRVIGRSMMIKWPAQPDQPSWDSVPDAFHNDSTYVDERGGARTYEIWLALQDITLENGCMHVVPHSHRLDRTIRGWGVDAPWLSYDDVFGPRAVPVELAAGEAVVFDPALVHRSGPNRTSDARVAVMILLSEVGEPLCVFRRRDEHAAEKVMVGDDFFSNGDYTQIAELPPVEVIELDMPECTEASVARQLDRHATVAKLTRFVTAGLR